jgi:hypothetical protein
MTKKLEDLTVPELKAKARTKRLKGYSNMSKRRLINLLRGKKPSKSRSRKRKSKRSRKSKSRSHKRKSKSRSRKRKSKRSRKSKNRSRKRKSKSRSRKRKSKRSRKSKRKGCTEQPSSKYSNRPSPPYSANECQGMIRIGNDGKAYASTGNRNGVHTWKLWKG